MKKHYYITKMSDTSADTLLAIGFASFLKQLCLLQHETDGAITLQDCGPYFLISMIFSLDVEVLTDDQLSGLLLVLPLDSSRQREKQTKNGNQQAINGFDYDGQLELSKIYREQVKKLGPGFQTPEARLRKAPELAALSEPDARLSHYQAINGMKIAGSFNELALRWDVLTPHQKRWHVALLLRLFAQPINDVSSAIAEWKKFGKEEKLKGDALASALQIINPTTGKGANRAKADQLTIGNQDSFWLLELLKFSGFMLGAAPLYIQDSDDRKTFIIEPRSIQLTFLADMMKQFRNVFWATTAVKLDIMAILRFAQVLVGHYEHSFAAQEEEPLLGMDLPPVPVSLATGFSVTFYKYLGTAHATMNIAHLDLPTWLPPFESLAQVLLAKEILAEHVQLVQSLRNSKGEEGAEEYELLHLYRDFLSGNDLTPFWKFTTSYSSYLMSALEKGRFVPLFTTKGLENLIMNNQRSGKHLKPILENEGFKHIADAIRNATITAQYRRSQQNDRTYDVRYGLGLDLKRKAHRPEEFMEALSLFLQQYSEETVREEEKVAQRLKKQSPLTVEERRAHKLRPNVSEQDLAHIADLIDQYSSGLICSMLIASGYARRSANEEEKK